MADQNIWFTHAYLFECIHEANIFLIQPVECSTLLV